MKTVPALYLSANDETYRVGDFITLHPPIDEPAGMEGSHDTLRITKIEWYERARPGYYNLHFVCIDCGDESNWAADRDTIESISRKLTTLEYARVMRSIKNKEKDRSEERRVGKECDSSVDLGGRRNIKKKKRQRHTSTQTDVLNKQQNQ